MSVALARSLGGGLSPSGRSITRFGSFLSSDISCINLENSTKGGSLHHAACCRRRHDAAICFGYRLVTWLVSVLGILVRQGFLNLGGGHLLWHIAVLVQGRQTLAVSCDL